MASQDQDNQWPSPPPSYTSLPTQHTSAQPEKSLQLVPLRQPHTYRLASIENDRNLMQVIDSASLEPLYTLSATRLAKTMTVYHGAKPSGLELGSCKFGFLSDIDLTLGSAKKGTQLVTKMTNKNRLFKTNTFAVHLPVGGGASSQKREFRWKGTHDVPGLAAAQDYLHKKLVDVATGAVVARFVHRSNSLYVMDGQFEIFVDQGPEWEGWVLMSGLALLKYERMMWVAGIVTN
jgi:hypothetical protein